MKNVKVFLKSKKAITLFILFHLIAIPASTSRPSKERSLYQNIFYPYLILTRLGQRWPLFTPEPRPFSLQYYAEIYYGNGSKVVWQRPYPPNWAFFPRHLSYNWQKLDLAANNLDLPYLWEDLGGYLERQHRVEGVPIVRILFFRSKADRPPPKEEGYVQHGDEVLKWQAEQLFAYDPLTRSIQ